MRPTASAETTKLAASRVKKCITGTKPPSSATSPGPSSRAVRSVVSISPFAAGSKAGDGTQPGSTACSAGRNSAWPAPSSTTVTTSPAAGARPIAAQIATRPSSTAARRRSAPIIVRRRSHSSAQWPEASAVTSTVSADSAERYPAAAPNACTATQASATA